MANDYEMTVEPTKSGKSGVATRTIWLALGCSLVVATGLAVGLGVGLSNNKVIEYITVAPPTDKPVAATTNSPGGGDITTPAATGPITTQAATEPPTTAMGPPSETGPWQNYRLPTYIIPSHYRLSLHPNMTTNIYTGTNAMTFTVTQATDYVIVHAHSTLNITNPTLTHESGTVIAIERTFLWPENQFYVVHAASPLLTGGEYILSLDFTNFLDKAIVGIYVSTYVDAGDNNITKSIVGSDMEPTDARRGYPCFDEPAMKVNYTTSIVHEAKHTALSNMDVDTTTTRPDGLMVTLFKTSVPMPTYLGCFVVSEFSYIESFSSRGIPLRVYATEYQIQRQQADYALKVMVDIFNYFETLFDMNYHLPKCDQIAIPNFGTGAMENWGLITYRETNLLWDPLESSTTNKQRVSQVVSHELVHQWFGNAVTMKWWDNIWLNEGFASYFEYIGLEVAEPDWQIMDHFVIDDLQPVLGVDSSITSHPVKVNVSTPAQITSVFDTISYSKGGSVLRMMREILGDDYFYGGLRNYLKKREFGNANEQDLWTDIQEYIDAQGGVGINVKEIMDPFVLQMGLPLVHVEIPEAHGGAPVSQIHMLSDPNANLADRPISEFDYKWNIHVSFYTSQDSTVKDQWMNIGDTGITLDVGNFTTGDWYKLNPNETGYYRVNYPVEMWDSFATQLETDFTVFTETDRSNLLDDGFDLAPAKHISYTQALKLTTYLDEEESYFVWDSFAAGSSYIRQMLQFNEEVYADFKEYYKSKVKPIADKLGWNATVGTHEEKKNRYTVLALALRYGDQDALNNATEMFTDWYGGEYIHPDVRQLVYRYGIVNSGAQEETYWNYMLERYKVETVSSEKSNLLRGLAATENIVLIDRLLEYSKDTSIIKEQDFFTCITYISYGINGNSMAWTWVQLNWEYMVERFGIDSRSLGNLVPNIVSAYNTDLLFWEVDSFFKNYPEAGAGERGRETALERIRVNIAWMADNEQDIADWLAAQLIP